MTITYEYKMAKPTKPKKQKRSSGSHFATTIAQRYTELQQLREELSEAEGRVVSELSLLFNVRKIKSKVS